ncbi:MAG: hypothetical protein QW264_06750, partial [Metallosphaera sp.]
EAVRIGDAVKKFNSLVRTKKVNMRLSMNSQINVILKGPNQFINDIRSVEEDVKRTLKISSISYSESQELTVDVIST